MAWEELLPPAAELELKNGVVKWNVALHLLMGHPQWVDLMWNADQNQLGIRAVNSATGLCVIEEQEGSEFKLDSESILDDAGVPTDITVSAEPDTWVQTNAGPGPGPATWFGYNTIYYLTLPE